MSAGVGYQLVAGPDFDLDYRRIDFAASRDRSGPEAALRRELLRTMLDLASGKSNGHHALSYAPGKGDLRDCVTAYLRSDPQQPPDYRLVIREIGPTAPGGMPRRELIAIKPRRGPNNVYAHVCARLSRHPDDRQPGFDRFDNWHDLTGGSSSRQAELDAKRAIAHAWDGQQPLRSSRPLIIGAPSRAPKESARDRVLQQQYDATAGTASEPTGHPPMPAARPRAPLANARPRNSRPGATGWPGNGRQR